MGIVTAHGVSVQSQYGRSAAERLEKAMQDAILQANAEGISNEHENSDVIRKRMKQAHQRELLTITREEFEKQVVEAEQTYQLRRAALTNAHQEHIDSLKTAFASEIAAVQAELED